MFAESISKYAVDVGWLYQVYFFVFQEHTVIRFRKSLPGEVSPDGGRTRVQREVGYTRNVVSCFLGSYVQIPEIVRFDATDIAKLSDAVRPHRPGKLFSYTKRYRAALHCSSH